MDYTIYAARTEDVNEGWIWIREPELPTRTLVKVYHPQSRRAVICQARRIDENFLKDREENYPRAPAITKDDWATAMLISEWYRDALGGFRTTTRTHQKVWLIVTPLALTASEAASLICCHCSTSAPWRPGPKNAKYSEQPSV